MLVARSPSVREGSDSVIVFTGPPNLLLTWNVSGPGTLTDPSPNTDASGIGTALFTPDPGNVGQSATISVTYRTE